jgi:ammonium transporter, Amt family
LLEAGAVRNKNTKNILLKNVIDACMAAIAWWAVGESFAHGSGQCSGNVFIGTEHFFASNVNAAKEPLYFSTWIFGYAFSATAATIVSGAVAERTQFRSYVFYTLALTAFIYPVVAYWVWSPAGWLSSRRVNCTTGEPNPVFADTNGLLDFAGSGVVHMVGGGAALVGAAIVGPRIGRFTNGHVVHFDGSNTTQVVLGTFILWLGWYGFNAGSTQCMLACMTVASRAAANTTLSIAAGGLSCLIIAILIGAPGDVMPLLNGILAGAVSITASCAMVEPYAAAVIGMVGAVVYTSSSKLMLRLEIDDPLDATAVHFFCGIWGVFATGLFATESGVESVYGYAQGWGVFYGGSGKQLGIQVLGIIAIAVWSCSLAAVIFSTLKAANFLRVSKEAELQGLDVSESIGQGRFLSCIFDRFRPDDDGGKDLEISVYNGTS